MTVLSGNSFYSKAMERAAVATKYIGQARLARKSFSKFAYLKQEWGIRIVNPEAILFTGVFLIACPVEVMVSYEMYREILANYSDTPSSMLVWLMGGFVVGMAAWVSHFFGLRISSSIAGLEVFNLMHQNEKLIPTEAEEIIRMQARKQLTLGIIFFILLLLLVAGISWQRSFLTSYATGNEDFSLLEKVLPIGVVIVEVFTGIYAAYLIKYFHFHYLKNSHLSTYEAYKEKGARETQMAFELLNQAKATNEDFELSKDLKDVLYRVTFLSKAEDKYVDEITISQCKVLVFSGNLPVSGVVVYGVLEGSQLTSSTLTDINGVAYLHWNTSDPLKAIVIAGQLFQGPIHSNSTHRYNLNKGNLLTNKFNQL